MRGMICAAVLFAAASGRVSAECIVASTSRLVRDAEILAFANLHQITEMWDGLRRIVEEVDVVNSPMVMIRVVVDEFAGVGNYTLKSTELALISTQISRFGGPADCSPHQHGQAVLLRDASHKHRCVWSR